MTLPANPRPLASKGDVPASAVLTIVTPFFNAGSVFDETASSVFRQSFQLMHWLVVDDGTTDPESRTVLQRYEGPLRRLQVIGHMHNHGLSAARNSGVAACQTSYFLQLDADDLIDPTFIEKALWALESHPEWAFCNAWHVAFGGRNYEWKHGFDRGPEFLERNQTIPVAVIRREADRAIGGHDESIREGCEDWDYWLKMAAHGHWGGTIPEFLIRYRIHEPPTRWPNRDDPVRLAHFRRELRRRYSKLWQGGWPKLKPTSSGLPRDDLPEIFRQVRPSQRLEKHLLLIIPWMTLGGADRFNLLLLEHLKQRGFSIVICATADGPNYWLDTFKTYTDDIFILTNFLRLEDYPRFIYYLVESRQIGTVLITASLLGYGLLPFLRARCPGVTFVDYVHMLDVSWGDGGYARASLNTRRWLDLSLVSCRQIKDWMMGQGAEAGRIEVCTINVDTARWDPARFDRAALRQSLGLPDNEIVILYAARLAPQKRPRLLAEVLRTLRRRGRSFTCLIAGDGPEYRWLEARLAWNRMGSSARLLGAVAPEQMPGWMAASDIFFLPSLDEGIALTIYEAMAMALPVVAADVGGQRELVTPETGLLVRRSPGEVPAYVAALEQLLDSPEARRALGQAARRRVVEHFTIEQMADRLVHLLDRARMLANAEPRPALSEAESLSLAAGVLAAVRQDALAATLFGEHSRAWVFGGQGAADAPGLGPARRVIRRLLRPLYHWGLANGFEWLVPLKNRVYRLLSPGPRA
jgi:glycosyltransferase involved in cell wall biosynthesis